jgi:hypothetical protein
MPSPSVDTTAAATIAGLARQGEIRSLPLLLVELVMAMRVAALFERAGRDPVPDLARRYRSVEAATAVDGLVRTVVRCWPERFMVNRPCCTGLTPDEATLAAIGRMARQGDREGFADQLAGFVRSDRHEALYQATIHAIALLPGLA